MHVSDEAQVREKTQKHSRAHAQKHTISSDVKHLSDSISPSRHSYTVYSADDDDFKGAQPKVSLFHRRPGLHTTPVFYGSLILVLLVVLLCALFPNQFLSVTQIINDFITKTFGWYYLMLVTAIVFFCVLIALSPAGRIKLGPPDSRPEHSNISWFAMLFSAGMGIGLVFYGAAEPLSHFAVSAPEAEVGSIQALQDSLKYCFFHWGISAWSVYAVVALALAYFKFRKHEKSLLSVTLKPLFGDKMNGGAGKVIDIVTSFATVAGVATSLGLGAMQINGGLSYLFDIPYDATVQLIIIAITTMCFIASAVSGINKGVKILSNVNVLIAIGLMAAALVVGPAVEIMNAFTNAIGAYLQDFVRLCLRTAPYSPDQNAWIGKWTIFYWAWWLSWSPFVGVFIARISKGRIVREFLLGVIIIPTLFSMIWFSVFGTLSCNAQMMGADLASLPTEQVLFGTFHAYPAGPILSLIAVVLVFSFFITSADSATFVLASLSEDGNITPHRRTKVVWGVLLSLIAAILLLAGGLQALNNILIISALPFSVVIALMCISLYRELNHERLMMGLYIAPKTYPDKGKPFRSYESKYSDDEFKDYLIKKRMDYDTPGPFVGSGEAIRSAVSKELHHAKAQATRAKNATEDQDAAENQGAVEGHSGEKTHDTTK